MSMPKFSLPSDPDKRMATAAMLTCAIVNMECGKDEAARRVHALYNEILQSSSGQNSEGELDTWKVLSDD